MVNNYTPIDIKNLQDELQAKWYSQEEIEKVLAWAKDINDSKFYTLEDVYKFLYAKKKIHVNA